jgi:DNA replication and repair protein RecF
MHIEHLSLTNFRNYARLELSLPTNAPVVLHGANAQGKTSLLEAVYYAATARSPYTTSDRQLIHWRVEDDPLPFARLVADIRSGQRALTRIEITVTIERGGEANGSGRLKKSIKINGVDRRVMDMVGLLNVVLFLPQDLLLVEGTPSDRRRFIDNTLGQIDANYLLALEIYERVLPQRNALLRRIAERQASPRELEYWDAQLVEAGAIIIAGRQRFLRELERGAQRAHHELTGWRETLSLRYQPSFAPAADGSGQLSFPALGLDLSRDLDPAQIAPQFAQRLRDEQRDSISRGVTLSGPHRDELRLSINDRDVGLYGSRGQARTAVMAFKLAELHWMRERTGEWPILLLDEVVAELDAQRRAYLLEQIDGATQTLVTTTELEIFTESFLARAAIWHVQDGQIVVERTPSGGD